MVGGVSVTEKKREREWKNNASFSKGVTIRKGLCKGIIRWIERNGREKQGGRKGGVEMNGCVVRINEDRLKLKYHFVEKTRLQRERERERESVSPRLERRDALSPDLSSRFLFLLISRLHKKNVRKIEEEIDDWIKGIVIE